MTTKHLFLGGVADGLQIAVHPARNFVQIQHDGDRLTQYRRRTIDTRNGPIDVFTHGIDCPVTALTSHYAQKAMLPALDAAVVNDASRYRALLAAEPAALRKRPYNAVLRWMRGKIAAPDKAAIDAALDAALNNGIVKI